MSTPADTFAFVLMPFASEFDDVYRLGIIETIYFYTGQNWIVHQSDRRCPSTESDLPQYKHRHFLATPIKRLQRSGWAQLRFVAERTVATAFRGEELKDSYPVHGHSILRLVTDKGLFDYEISIDTVAEAVPF